MNNEIAPIPAWTIKDLQIASGLSRPTVIKYIEQGILPGYRMPGGKYVIPALWALAWMRGEWTPHAPEAETVKPVTLVRRNAA